MNFDYLRLFLAVIVMIDHYGIVGHQKILNGGLSVDAFFIISGFLITKSCMNSDLGDYFKKRLARIYPPIILLTILMIFFGQGIEVLSVLVFQDFSIVKNIYNYGTFWTLVIEFQFYLLTPILIWSLKENKIITLFILSFLYGFSHALNSFEQMHTEVTRLNILVHSHLFITGIIFALYFDKIERKIIWLIPLTFYSFYRHFFHPSIIWSVLYPIAVACMIFLIANQCYKIFGKNSKFGDPSYGIYLYHFPVMIVAAQYGVFSKLFLALIVMICALLSWHFVEKPILKLFKNNVKKEFKTSS